MVQWQQVETSCDILSYNIRYTGNVMWLDSMDENDRSASAEASNYTIRNAIAYTNYSVEVTAIVVGNLTGPAGICVILTAEEGT